MMKLLFARGYMIASSLSMGALKATSKTTKKNTKKDNAGSTGYAALNDGGNNTDGLVGLATGIGQDVMSIIKNVGLILAVICIALGGLALIWNNKQAMERQNQKNGFVSILAGILFIVGAVALVGWIVGIIESAVKSSGTATETGKAIMLPVNMVMNLLR